VKTTPVISLKSVSVSYQTILSGEKTLKGFMISLVKRKRSISRNVKTQLREISLEINHGEQVGIIGRNGSGKSTLLKLIAGVLRPDEGSIHIDGSITPLIDIGTGMNPELTCRENIYLSGAYLGLSREDISHHFDSIVLWAEIADYLDQPFHTLSTGMQSRLAFAVSTCQVPEIVLIDEVMSVGDISFQEKSARRLDDLIKNGSAVLVVSHDMTYLRSAVTRVVWIKDGVIEQDGPTNQVIDAYLESF